MLMLILGAAAVAAYPGGASARMSRCQVHGRANLPIRNGASLICAEIDQAIAHASPNARYTVEVRVLSSSRLAAAATVNGRALPEQNFAVMDRDVDAKSIRRFAEALAGEVAKAAKE